MDEELIDGIAGMTAIGVTAGLGFATINMIDKAANGTRSRTKKKSKKMKLF